MQYTVPQFIDTEDKIVGPVSVRQFVIMLMAAFILFLVYQVTDLTLFIISAIPIAGAGAVLAFYRVNGQPFHMFLLHVTQTAKDPSLRVWRKEVSRGDIEMIHAADKAAMEEGAVSTPEVVRTSLTGKKLSELSLVVDTGGVFQGGRAQGGELFD